MNWIKKYYNDWSSKGAIGAIILFCVALWATGLKWWIPAVILLGFGLLFYIKRKTP